MSLFDSGIYVHYQPNHVRNYQNVKTKLLQNYNDANLKSMVVRNLAKTSNITAQQQEAFFDFLGGFGGSENALAKGLEQYFSSDKFQLITPLTSFEDHDNLYDALNKVIKDPNVILYSQINNQIKAILKQLQLGGAIQSINNDLITNYLKEALTRGIFSPPASATKLKKNKMGSQVYEGLKQIFNSFNNQAVVINPNTEFSSQQNLIQAILVLTQLLDSYSSGGEKVSVGSNEVINDYLSYIVNRLPSTIGFAYQAIVANLSNKVTDQVCQDFSFSLRETGANSVQVKYSPSQNKANRATVNTQDLGIQVNFSSPQTATLDMQFYMPGISLKYNAAMANGLKTNAFIKLRGKAVKLGPLLHDIDNQTLSSIYNILASYNHKSQLIKSNPITFPIYQDLWAGLKVVLAANALIGQARSTDFAYYFVISNKVYTVPEIIRHLVNQANNNTFDTIGLEMAQVPTIRPTQKHIANSINIYKTGNGTPKELAQQRSSEVINAIYSASVVAGIRLKIGKIKS